MMKINCEVNCENEFVKALISNERNDMIPKELDWFGDLVGEWDIIWTSRMRSQSPKTEKGEWIFSRVLNGCAIQDLFIVLSREERVRLNMPNAEYGTTIRMYRPDLKLWEIYYTCIGEYIRLSANKDGDKIVLTEQSGNMKWVFSDICETSFHWQNIRKNETGIWEVECDCRAENKRLRPKLSPHTERDCPI